MKRMINTPSLWLMLSTILAILISYHCLANKWLVIFQNIYYLPIILACILYPGRGLIFSLALSVIYLICIIAFSSDHLIWLEGVLRFGLFLAVAGVVTFISSLRQKQENELKFKNALLEAQSETTLDGILIVDPQRQTLFSNQHFAELWKIPQPIIDTRDDKKMIEFVLKQLVDPQGFVSKTEYLYSHQNKNSRDEIAFLDGRIFERYSSPLILSDGKHLGRIWYFRDISAQRKAEEKLEEAGKIKAASDLRTKLTDMVSHELRTPLAVIKESINLFLDGMVGNITGEQRHLLDILKSNIDRLGRLINNVLDFQKIEAGKMRYDIRENDLNEIVIEAQKLMSILARKKGLELTVKIDKNIPKFFFDKDRLFQVITNLLSNAIKFTEKGNITLNTLKEKEAVHLTVRDTGLAIEKKDLDRLFQAFEQIEDIKRAKQPGGTGLGLAISKEIILAHQGKIWAESTPGQGATFHVLLPLKSNWR